MDYAGEITQASWASAPTTSQRRGCSTEKRYPLRRREFEGGRHQSVGPRSKLDNFGGILGFTWFTGNVGSTHCSGLNNFYDLIRSCREVNPADYKPAGWDDVTMDLAPGVGRRHGVGGRQIHPL